MLERSDFEFFDLACSRQMSRITAVTMKQLLILTIQCTLHLANLIFVKELVKVCLDVRLTMDQRL